MRIKLHIGLEACGGSRIQEVLDAKRDQLAGKGVLYPYSPGRRNHSKVFMAATAPDHVDLLRFARGFADPQVHRALRETVVADLAQEVEATKPDLMILSAVQFSSGLWQAGEIEYLKGILSNFSSEIEVIAYVDEQARVLTRHYAAQIWQGRTAPLTQDLALADAPDWRAACLALHGDADAALNRTPEVQAPPFWLDYAALVRAWEGVFGAGSVTLRPYDPALFASEKLTAELSAAFDLPKNIGKADPAPLAPPPSSEWLARARLLNADLGRLLEKGRVVPRKLWRRLLNEVQIGGAPIDPGSLSAVSSLFKAGNARLLKTQPALTKAGLSPDRTAPDWTEPAPTLGYRSTSYIAALMPRIEKNTREARQQPETPPPAQVSPLLGDTAMTNYIKLRGGPFAPHNRLGQVNEEELAAAFTPAPARDLPAGSSGNVIVGCMKNEAPYILEWVAYHRAIGVDNFLIYTNGCEDGTDKILDRLQDLGLVQHRNNDNWKGNSPQQYALNRSLKEPLIENADWIIHIDVDEFINVRCDNGTLVDFFARVPEATNVAMTWRLFGHNGVTAFRDDLVIDQFDACAPKFCPKPHTAWGFKTMFRNIGAYTKISCHRPNKLNDDFRDKVVWVNGSGQPMGDQVLDNGWRSSKGSIGYDLLQLNHYALRSAESFLIKRQRGRALHVDRSIGLNYWVRMDWCDYRDVTIKRNIPRTRAELGRLMQDDKLAQLHADAVAWHKDKAASLRAMPEFQELYTQALQTRLSDLERVAYALALEIDN